MKTKLALTFFCLACFISVIQAQDIITKKNGEEIKATVAVVDKKEVRYRLYDDELGHTYSLSKSEIFMIKYENGTKDVFTESVKTAKYRNPAAAFGLSLVFPGLGQFYNGQKGKGIVMCSLTASYCLVNFFGSNTGDFNKKSLSETLSPIPTLVLIGTYIWSLADASISANAINRRNQGLSWDLDNNRKLSLTPDILFSNSIGTKTHYQSPAYGFSMKLDF